MAFIQTTSYRIAWGLISFVSYVFYEAHREITQHAMDFEAFATLVSASGFAWEAIAQYPGQITQVALRGSALLVGIALPSRAAHQPRLTKIAWALPIFPLGATMVLAGIVFARSGYGSTGLPANFPVLAFSSLYTFELLKDGRKARRAVEIGHSENAEKPDIIIMIDESVRGDYLDINSPNGVRSGLKEQREGLSILNYGIAASAGNCSNSTNIILRYGGTRNDYRRFIETMPSIWDYGKRAGYRTVYIDAQRVNGNLQNGMTAAEITAIDEFVQLDTVAVRQRDVEVAKIADQRTRNSVPELIFINKLGAHFPIQDKYPDEFLKHKPVLPRGESRFEGVSDTGDRSEFSGEWTQYKDSYKNTILWNVRKFFDVFLDNADLENAVVIYTSDHGQNFHERGDPGTATHCSSIPSIEEGAVPLVVLTHLQRAQSFMENLATNRNHTSHYNIFPTVLKLLGFEKTSISQIYGLPLTDIANDPMTFNAKFEARFGQSPNWVRVQPDRLVGP